MAAYIKTLQDASRENIIYPRTKSEAVYRDDNATSVEETLVNLESEVASIIENTNGISGIYETKEDASAKLEEAKTYTDEQIANHTHSWNDLTDKPFGETESWTLITSLEFEGTYANPNLLNTSVKNIKFVFDGEEYFFDFYGDGTYGGDGYPFEFSAEFSGFAIGYVLYITCDDGFHTVEIYKGKTTVKTIDAKYLPDSVKAQPDWHQNDESAPDYVKNRFGGYYENTYSTVLEETTLEFEPYAGGNGYYTFIDDYNVAEKLFGSKSTVKVTFDGVVYEKAFDKASGFDSDETIPFGFYVQIADGAHLQIDTTLEGDTHTVKIEKVEKLPVTISEEFLPDSVKAQPDWNQNDESAPDFVKNKPVVFEPSDTLTWDGNTEGLEEMIEGSGAYKISSAVPTIDDFSHGVEITLNGNLVNLSASQVREILPGYIGVGEWVVCVASDNFDLDGIATIKSRGVYFTPGVSSLTIPGYTGFGQEKIAPSHLYQPDWNQNDESAPDFVKNKPVVFEPSDTLTWDGNTVDRVSVNANGSCFVHMSDAVPSVDDFASGGAFTVMQNGSSDICAFTEENITTFYDGVYGLPTLVFIVVQEEAVGIDLDGAVFPIKGTYLLLADDSTYCSSLTIHNYTGFGQEKIAPSHLYQPDWNQNDESAPDYVKNRPFYIAKEIIASDVSVETSEGNDSVYSGDLTAEVAFTSGEQYEVVFEGVSYVLAAINLNDIVFLGNAALYFAITHRYTVEEATNQVLPGLGLPVNNVPFCIVDENGDYLFYTTSTVSPAIFSVYGENVAKINEKFLPDTVATKADIEAAIGAAIGGSY